MIKVNVKLNEIAVKVVDVYVSVVCILYLVRM